MPLDAMRQNNISIKVVLWIILIVLVAVLDLELNKVIISRKIVQLQWLSFLSNQKEQEIVYLEQDIVNGMGLPLL